MKYWSKTWKKYILINKNANIFILCKLFSDIIWNGWLIGRENNSAAAS